MWQNNAFKSWQIYVHVYVHVLPIMQKLHGSDRIGSVLTITSLVEVFEKGRFFSNGLHNAFLFNSNTSSCCHVTFSSCVQWRRYSLSKRWRWLNIFLLCTSSSAFSLRISRHFLVEFRNAPQLMRIFWLPILTSCLIISLILLVKRKVQFSIHEKQSRSPKSL